MATEKQYQNVRAQNKRHQKRMRAKKNRALVLLVVLLVICIGGVGAMAVNYYTSDTYLVLNGGDHMDVGQFGMFRDPGVTAKKGHVDVSDSVEVTSDVDTTTPGEYLITYKSGNFSIQRTVTVLDHMSPALELKGKRQVGMKLGERFKEPGYTATADDGTDLTDRVEVSDNDLRRAGTHDITYTVSDDEGHTTSLTRRVQIEPNTDYDSPGLPICMYHYVYDDANPPADVNDRWKNYISKHDLIEEMEWLNQEGYYYPTWSEVRDYVDGKLLLPEKSIVLTFDDGEKATLEQLKPITDQTHVPVTSFLITEHNGKEKVKKYAGKYLQFQSHTHKLHHAGGAAGYRGMLPVVDFQTGVDDLETSVKICGSSDAIAYPYGDYNENVHAIVSEVGFKCGVTTQWGKAYPGMDPLVMPRIRMWQDQTLEHFISVVAPQEAQ